MNTLPINCEFETKYYTDLEKLPIFKNVVNNLDNLKEFVYAEGPDIYWTKDDDDDAFARYRRANFEKKPIAWLTMKWKEKGATSNIKRKEINWTVTDTPFEDINEGVVSLGFKPNFKIWKMTHVYKFEDATLAFYTVEDEKHSRQSFIEIEVSEEWVRDGQVTEEQALNIIRKYEGLLSEVGITAQHRVKKSLFEMYRRNSA